MFFETQDRFTSSEYVAISAFGLTEPGKEYEAVENGVVAQKINPFGVGASDARMFLDPYKQVNGTAGDYQVGGVKNGIMLSIGGSATTNYVFIVGRE